MGFIHFSQIHPRAFAHSADRKATSALEKLPLFPDLLKKISQLGIEERFRAHHMYNSLQVSSSQFESIHCLVADVAKRLDLPPPATFISRQGQANAFAFGKNAHSIVLTTELIEMMDAEELRGIIAHEMGHILCQHMLYMDVGLALTMRSGAVPKLARALPGLEESISGLFFAWFRAAEYSADRAALLILGDPEPLARALSRLAGVPRKLEAEFELEVFAEQVKNYEEEATFWSRIANFGTGLFLTHPEPAKRVGALMDWAQSKEYEAIRDGRYLTRFEVEAGERVQIEGVRSCPLCRSPAGEAAICRQCGLAQDLRHQQHCPNGHVNAVDWRFCKSCGTALTGARHSETPRC